MRLKDYSEMENNLRNEKVRQIKKGNDTNTFAALLLLIEEAKDVLFNNGKYKKLRKWHILRIWNIAKIALKLIHTLLAIFSPIKVAPNEDDLK